jgi:tRNA (uracil-5-)-methyltransferase TRM9
MPTFYDIHADAFSKSRFRIWPLVKTFIDSLPSHSRVLDIGCGNGKNMLYRSDLNFTGIEYSDSLCNICNSRGLNVIQGDARTLPFKDNTFDAIIMIAVIHHINPQEHFKVLNEIKRVLTKDGKCIITNWAVEQPEESKRQFYKGLNMVVWKGKDETPLPYWVMDGSMAKDFSNNLPNELKSEKVNWDAGNWYFEISKINHP